MDIKIKQALINKLTAMADDELILAHRDSEWTGHAPILEEDIALANIAQDELGHATIFYGLLEDLTGTTPDQYAMFRDADEFRNVQLVELPKGDWAFTMLRQYLFDTYEFIFLAHLEKSAYQPLAEAVAKIRKEEIYHLQHTHLWVERLGLGTSESNRRMQNALNELWPVSAQLFMPLPDEPLLVEAGYVPDSATLKAEWEQIVGAHLNASDLTIPNDLNPVTVGREQHTPHLAALLADMQMVARAYPDADW